VTAELIVLFVFLLKSELVPIFEKFPLLIVADLRR